RILDRIKSMRQVQLVHAGLDVLSFGLTIGVGDFPVEVLDEGQLVEAAAQTQDVTGQFAVVVLGPVGTKGRVAGPFTQGRGAGDARSRRIGAVGPGRDHVAGHGRVDDSRQEGVVATSPVRVAGNALNFVFG